MPQRIWTSSEIAFLRRHAKKQTSTWIAEQLGRTRSAVLQCRARQGLDTPQPSRRPGFDDAIRRGHAKGWSDSEIAAELGTVRENVRSRRRCLRLPANGWTEHQKQRTRERTIEQLRRAGLKSLAELRVKAFQDYARGHGWPADLPPRCVQILEVLGNAGPQTREQLTAALRMKWHGSRTSLKGGCQHKGGSYLAILIRRGLVMQLKRAVKRKGKGHNVSLYTLPLTIERKFDQPAGGLQNITLERKAS
jgi:hypothetical protein